MDLKDYINLVKQQTEIIVDKDKPLNSFKRLKEWLNSIKKVK